MPMGQIVDDWSYKPGNNGQSCPLVLALVDRQFRQPSQPVCTKQASPTQTHCRTAHRSGEASAYVMINITKGDKHMRQSSHRHAAVSQKDVHLRPDP